MYKGVVISSSLREPCRNPFLFSCTVTITTSNRPTSALGTFRLPSLFCLVIRARGCVSHVELAASGKKWVVVQRRQSVWPSSASQCNNIHRQAQPIDAKARRSNHSSMQTQPIQPNERALTTCSVTNLDSARRLLLGWLAICLASAISEICVPGYVSLPV